MAMEKLQRNVPTMWADHHVLKVRAALTALEGVQSVVASSSFRVVSVVYDPAVIAEDAIVAALTSAGYPIAEDTAEVLSQVVPVKSGKIDPAWERLGFRTTRTDARDARPGR